MKTAWWIIGGVWVSLVFLGCGESSDSSTDGDAEREWGAEEEIERNETPEEEADASDAEREELEESAETEEEASYVCTEPEGHPALALTPDETFDLGPYLMSPSPTSQVVVWRTLEEGDGAVLFGLSADGEPTQEVTHEGTATIHIVTLTGLTPATEYAYRVRTSGVTSALHRFRSAPEAGRPFRFVVWGDNQDGPETFVQVVAQMASDGPDFALGVGDLVQNGLLNVLWKDQLFGPARGLFHQVPFYTAIGNHEANAPMLYDLYVFPHPEENPQHESFYSFTYGNAFFLVVDTNKAYFSIGTAESEISRFAKEQMDSPEAKAATWRFALAHEPGYSEAWGSGNCDYEGSQPVREWLLPLLAEKGFHAYFSGHTHGYERADVPGGLIQFINGGGGGSLDAWCKDWPETKVVHYAHHHLVVDAGCDELRIQAVDLTGQVFDWVVLASGAPGQIVEQGPMEGLPDPPVNPDSPTLTEER